MSKLPVCLNQENWRETAHRSDADGWYWDLPDNLCLHVYIDGCVRVGIIDGLPTDANQMEHWTIELVVTDSDDEKHVMGEVLKELATLISRDPMHAEGTGEHMGQCRRVKD